MQLTVRDVSKFLDVSESTVIRWIKQRGLAGPARGRPVPLQPGRAAGVGDGQPRSRFPWSCSTTWRRMTSRAPAWPRRWKPAASSTSSRTPTRSGPCAAWSRSCRCRTASTASCSCGSSWPGRLRRRTAIGDGIALPHVRNPDRPPRRAADGHALLPGAAGRLRGAGRQAGAGAVLAHLPDDAEPPADAVAAVLCACTTRGSRRP